MEISIKDAADLLGKSERTVRHMAQTGRLPARRVGSRWLIDRDDLMSGKYSGQDGDDAAAETAEAEAEAPATAVQEDNFEGGEEASVSAERPRLRFDRALPPGTPSVRALDSFHIAADLLAELGELRRDLRDAAHLRDAEQNLRGFIQALADGIHADLGDQPERFRAARTQVCAALTDLIHFNVTHDKPDLTPLVDRIEHELLGSLQLLIGTADERSSWRYRVRGLAERTAARVFSRLRGLAGEGRVGARLAALEERIFGASAPVTVN
ncbi:DNA binding domain-containing protein, excisionase family [Nannocystis exedens]|uniref:DNA binding domain-containing protein, excisionase family n=1 Tax=Nannocystis exedens TaxID=54 RepID=A0A1I1TM65_9BACT|nr:helix-turn-helix domain-containing protein [Nannocystis exedens]PCC66429.1 Helix-turn-helix domain protein [Nannocystis exedens]SFD59776.1 DNA binding domain-containing protein, excisionase family [Nannocystis exedens]